MDVDGKPLVTSGLCDAFGLSRLQRQETRHRHDNGLLLILPEANRSEILEALRTDLAVCLSQVEGPWMVRVNVFSQPGRILSHLVNYNREETEESGPVNEKPIAVNGINVNLRLPEGTTVNTVLFIFPDVDEREGQAGVGEHLDFDQSENRVTLHVPQVLVYGVVMVSF